VAKEPFGEFNRTQIIRGPRWHVQEFGLYLLGSEESSQNVKFLDYINRRWYDTKACSWLEAKR
jgi:hypothetical protein